MKKTKPAYLCNRANEYPCWCMCDEDCFCQTTMCVQAKAKETTMEKECFEEWQYDLMVEVKEELDHNIFYEEFLGAERRDMEFLGVGSRDIYYVASGKKSKLVTDFVLVYVGFDKKWELKQVDVPFDLTLRKLVLDYMKNRKDIGRYK